MSWSKDGTSRSRNDWLTSFLIICTLVAFVRFEYWNWFTSRSPNAQPVGSLPNPRYDWAQIPFRFPVLETVPLPTSRKSARPRIQAAFGDESHHDTALRLKRRQKVQDVFVRCWDSYKERAWLKDELNPVSGNSSNPFGGWATTLVDSLDTMFIMGMKEELESAKDAISKIDFSAPAKGDVINVFETNIRHLGGLLSTFDLTGDKVFLDKAVQIGELLYHCFDTANHRPIIMWNFVNAAHGGDQWTSENTNLASLGSLAMEFTRLSQLTQDPKWYSMIASITDSLAAQQNSTRLPGMWPIEVHSRGANLTVGITYSLGGNADSAYEYLPKQHLLLGGAVESYRTMYEYAMDTAIKNVIFRPMVPKNDDILISGRLIINDTRQVDPMGEHLTCFVGGMFALGSRLFELTDQLDIAEKLTKGCVWAYDAMPSGIMPDVFHALPCPVSGDCDWDSERWAQGIHDQKALAREEAAKADPDNPIDEDDLDAAFAHLTPGFTRIGGRAYQLRPEAAESLFILFRITGDEWYRDAAWRMFQAIDKHTRAEYGHATLEDVTVQSPPKRDQMESFWMAETLKYLYLIFSEPTLISLDEFVFNTEAHPFRIPS